MANLHPAIIEILKKRGVEGDEAIEEFISPKPQRMHDPFLLLNMDAGVDLILSSIEEGKNICIYGDYDADGVTSVSLMYDVLSTLGAHVSYYIPSRFDEGYGLNNSALDKIKNAGAEVVVTVDCGCTSVAEARHAKEIGLELMVTDHHTLRDEIPDCILIDPLQPQCPYPFKYLAGVGVAFKVAQALVETAGLPKEVLTRNLDLVGIGTIGDIVPLVDENRTLTKYGLRAINITRRPGLEELLRSVGLEQGKIDSRQVSFGLVPYINAAGRMGDATSAARLMQTEDENKARILVEKLQSYNNQRKTLQEQVLEQCRKKIEEQGETDEHFILMELEEAHEGVTGIVAGKLKDEYNLPSVIVTQVEEDSCKGTARSIAGVNLFEILNGSKDLFQRFGGHAAACGFMIAKDNVPKLREVLREGTERIFGEEPELFAYIPEGDVDISPEDITMDLVGQLKLLEPFGRDNPEPTFGMRARIFDYGRMGNQGQYLRYTAEFSDGSKYRGVDFRHSDDSVATIQKAGEEEREVEIVGVLEKQSWNDREYIQINTRGMV